MISSESIVGLNPGATNDLYDCTDQRFTTSFILTVKNLIVHFDVSKASYNILFYEAADSRVGMGPRLRPHTRKSKLKKSAQNPTHVFTRLLYLRAIEKAEKENF